MSADTLVYGYAISGFVACAVGLPAVWYIRKQRGETDE